MLENAFNLLFHFWFGLKSNDNRDSQIDSKYRNRFQSLPTLGRLPIDKKK
ncbi:4562_t:CDS:2 [Funneliformis mosseae]|uniref:4562_t:CDS:1 n=1 Tax=Funneliformis mosseae TaxID=27381 RepID=A0A9N8Z6D7_FUNMO|nr:4562_t:CDS:2 [Funneliformis mosseae]